MARSKIKQVFEEPHETGRERNTIDLSVADGITGRTRLAIDLQPAFVKTITRRRSMSRVQSDPLRYGDIRAEDLFPESIATLHIQDAAITNAKVNDLSADKINTGTLDAGLVTVSSDDGKMTLSNNILQIKNGSNVIQLTLGKYDGTNYGLAVGSDPSNPDIVMDSTGITVETDQYIQLNDSRIIFSNPANSRNTLMGYTLGQFQIQGDTTDGIVLFHNVTLGSVATPTYGSGNGVFHIQNAQAAPSSNPSNGGILYAQAGALKWRGSGGTTTTIATA